MGIALQVDLRKQVAKGEVTHTVRALRAGSPALRLHAVSFESVHVGDADGAPLSFTYDGTTLEIRWAHAWRAGDPGSQNLRVPDLDQEDHPRNGRRRIRPL